jgi:hypothetical protein
MSGDNDSSSWVLAFTYTKGKDPAVSFPLSSDNMSPTSPFARPQQHAELKSVEHTEDDFVDDMLGVISIPETLLLPSQKKCPCSHPVYTKFNLYQVVLYNN